MGSAHTSLQYFPPNSTVISYDLYQSAKVQQEKWIKHKCIYSISLVNPQQGNSWIMNVFASLLAVELLINVWTIRQFTWLWAKESVSQSLVPCWSLVSWLTEQLNGRSAANDPGSKPTHVITATASPLWAFVDFITPSEINPAQGVSAWWTSLSSESACMSLAIVQY